MHEMKEVNMSRTQSPIQIPGYTYGTSAVAKSPLSEQDFDLQALWRLILKEYCPRPAELNATYV
jgi:hypothetical protein